MISLNHYLFLSTLLFAIGFFGLVYRRNIIVILMCVELMLSAANITLVAFSRFHVKQYSEFGGAVLPNFDAQALVFYVITVSAAEIAVALAIVVAIYRAMKNLDISTFKNISG